MDRVNKKNLWNVSAFTLIVSFICLALVGVSLVPFLPIKLNPSRVLPGFVVRFNMPGSSAFVVEQTVTSKLESMLARIEGVKNISSVSENGWGSITVDMDKHADIDAVRFEASTIVRQTWAELPDGVSYPYIQMKSPNENAMRPFMSFTLNAPSTPILIQRYAEEHIKNQLSRLHGIYEVDVQGATPMEWRLEYDSDQLHRLGLTVNDISMAVNRFYSKEFLGTCNIELSSGREEWIRLALMSGESRHVTFDPSLIWVQNKDGKMIHLDELVKVTHEEESPSSYYRINGLNSIYLSLTAEESANQLELSEVVYKKVNEMQRNLPPGYEIHINYDATEYIQKELDKIYFCTSLTVIILLLFVLLITRSFKYLCLIAVSICVNLFIAIIFYYLLGVEIQLYSLAGITISLNLIIDNTIVMTDHYLRKKDAKVFISILAATLTTVGALSIIFFLDENARLNLQDFAAVVIINLIVSLFVALFFVPSLIEKIHLKHRVKYFTNNKHTNFVIRNLQKAVVRFPVFFTRFYQKFIVFLCRWRVAVCIVLLLSFGLPSFLFPEKIEKESSFAGFYNKTLGSPVYKEKIKPVVDKILGGSWRLFAQKVTSGGYYTRSEEVVLSVNASLPTGSTIAQMNALIRKMEVFLSRYKEIKQFQTTIFNAQCANISIYFKDEYRNTGFPYTLKSDIISQALQLGGGSWAIYGLEDMGFNNDVHETSGSYRVKMYGYNYDDLYHYAEELKKVLLSHRRIKEVTISSNFSYWKDDYQEFYFDLNKERMAQQNISALGLFSAISPIFGQNLSIGSVVTNEGYEQIKLTSRQSGIYDIWSMQHVPYEADGKLYKLSDVAMIAKGQTPQQVAKENQQYRLCLQYEYIGSYQQGYQLLHDDVEAFNKKLPIGYTAEIQRNMYSWGDNNSMRQFLLLFVVVAIIFFITSILFNSLKQPLAIIGVIPISYIGVFLTFYWFDLKFDQGGFAAFVLLCGITVNASIYILNEYNSIRKRFPKMSSSRAYVKAWNIKIIPIVLTIVSTILGFIPFMIGQRESFWFPLSAGTIGGLVMSLLGVFILLPILTLKKKDVVGKL